VVFPISPKEFLLDVFFKKNCFKFKTDEVIIRITIINLKQQTNQIKKKNNKYYLY